jgi:hypothetical protein
MLESLPERLQAIFRKLPRHGVLGEADTGSLPREVRDDPRRAVARLKDRRRLWERPFFLWARRRAEKSSETGDG